MLHCRKTVKFPRANKKGGHRRTPWQFCLKNFSLRAFTRRILCGKNYF
jgi:hypothetical protein